MIQQMPLQALTPIFDPMFSEHSYRFRPGRSAQDAMRAARKYAQEGKDGVVHLDITKLLDNIRQDLLLRAVKKHAQEQWMVLYIERSLESANAIRRRPVDPA